MRKPRVRVAPITPWKVTEPGRPPRGVPWAPPPRNRGLAWKEKGHFRPLGSGLPPATVLGRPRSHRTECEGWKTVNPEHRGGGQGPRPGLCPRPRRTHVHLMDTWSLLGSTLSLLVFRPPQVRKALRPPYTSREGNRLHPDPRGKPLCPASCPGCLAKPDKASSLRPLRKERSTPNN